MWIHNLKPRQRILAGTRILVPHAEVEDESKVEKFAGARVYEQVERPAIYHTVRAKDSLPRIAARYGVSAATLWPSLTSREETTPEIGARICEYS